MPNVAVFFNRKLVHADLDTKVAVFADSKLRDSFSGQKYERVNFDLLRIGADGAHSAVRHHMARYTNIDMSQQWLDPLVVRVPHSTDQGWEAQD